jgi:hypothetical protein
MKPAPDPDLVRTAKAGDEAAFEQLLRPLIDPAYRFACVMLNDPSAAEDVVQEAATRPGGNSTNCATASTRSPGSSEAIA